MMKLRSGVDILIATPGRLLDLFRKNAVKFGQVEMLVLDEADRMLDLGFIGDIRNILDLLPKTRQNLLFSATFSTDIRTLTRDLFKNPVQIEVNPRNSTAKSVRQWAYEVNKKKKPALLSHLLRNNNWEQVPVFTRTKNGANSLVQKLTNDGISSAAIHGDKSQGVRTRTLADFKANNIRILIATDIAARGLDINELSHVINFDLPQIAEDYIHRIGRTGRTGRAGRAGRAGSEGVAISLIGADEAPLLSAIENLIRQNLVRETENGFIPTHSVPLTRLMKVGPKKPKTAQQKHTGGAISVKLNRGASHRNKKR